MRKKDDLNDFEHGMVAMCNQQICNNCMMLYQYGRNVSSTMCVCVCVLLFLLFTPHLSTCECRCPWPSPAVSLDQSHQSLQPACCTGTDILTRRAAESLEDQICKGGKWRSGVQSRTTGFMFRRPNWYLILKGVAGSTLGLCFWGASSSFLFLFHPNHPLRGK